MSHVRTFNGWFDEDRNLELNVSNAASSSGGSTLREAREEFEREIIARRLQENSGNISKTAKILGISRPTLYELIARYGLDWRSN